MKKIEMTVIQEHAGIITNALNKFGIDDIAVYDVQNACGENMLPPLGDWCIHYPDYRKKIEIVVNDDQVNQIIAIIQTILPKIRRSDFLPRPTYGDDIFISSVEEFAPIQQPL